MNLQDNSLFDYQVYPFNQPDSQDFTDLPQWGYIRVTSSAADQIEAYMQNSKALNYFAKSLLTPFEDIPIHRMYATFMDDTNKSILTIGYPNSMFFIFFEKGNFSSKRISSSVMLNYFIFFI